MLVALNLVPGLDLALAWQLGVVVAVAVVNMVVWRRSQVEPMPPKVALGCVLLGLLILGAVAAIDTLIGFSFSHERTVADALLHSGPLGGVADVFLFLCGLVVGVPTLARAVYLYYRRQP